MVPRLVKKIVIKTLHDRIAGSIKKYGVRVFLEQFIKFVSNSRDEKMEKLADDLQTALDNYNATD